MMDFKMDIEHPITISSQQVQLDGLLYLPRGATGIVLFVHGSGSSRFSTRNQYVARMLNEAKLGTLLFDLLTPEEEKIDTVTSEFRFDIEFLASRLLDVTDWCLTEKVTQKLAIGYFGASTGGGAALVAAAKKPHDVKAVVSRGGRPDLAGDSLSLVKAPTLLIVGGNDKPVIEMNQYAMSKLQCETELEIVPGATHLFEEVGALDAVGRLARKWLVRYLNS